MSSKHSSKLTMGLVIVLLLAAALVLVACQDEPTTAPNPTQPVAQAEPCPTSAPCPEPEACPDCPAVVTSTESSAAACPFTDEWAASGHADAEAEAFRHWDEEDPKEVPVDCAKCHAGSGFRDFVGADGSAAGVVDSAHPVDTVIDCQTCHNEAASEWNLVTFPSGISVTLEGPHSR